MSVSIDQQFVEFVVKSLVSNPDAVSIVRTIDEKGVLLELTVAPEDLGRVIGKRGGTAQSIRTLLRALGTKNEARYNLKIVDSDGGSGATQSGPQSEAVDSDNAMLVNSEDSNPVEEDEAEVVENSSSEYEEKHRKDLADLDDLDI
ncbi:KH domain-containing protein [Candidatus Nomurabacteria bacterium]|jgi:predicted RNA-binding protein YlqC (UPF0109 family)|nr:KH domain-containing protein [Candidatus Saccharibacteria bacterium]MCB9821894.1 KH domain-containing protein [Candidatus Nomurabacteria bacterium]